MSYQCPSLVRPQTYTYATPIDGGKGKAYYEFDLNAANYLKHRKLYFELISNSYMDLKNITLQSIYEMKSESYVD